MWQNQAEEVCIHSLYMHVYSYNFVFICLLFVFACDPLDHRSRTPIIIVPSAATSLITMYNAKGLLEDYK